jgi:hypothetical protein
MPYGSYRYDGEYLCWFYTKFDGDNGRVDTIFSGITAIYSIEGGENCRPRSIDGFAELYAPAFRLSVGNSSGVQFSDEAPCNGLLGCEIYAKYRSNGKIYIAKCDFPDPEVPRRSDDTCTVVVENVFGVSEISLIFPHSNKISNREVARRRIAQAAKWIDVIQSSYVRLAR